jgi:hypothetical protein
VLAPALTLVITTLLPEAVAVTGEFSVLLIVFATADAKSAGPGVEVVTHGA